MKRIQTFALAACLAAIAGCNDDDDDDDSGPGPSTQLATRDSFSDDFSGDFPAGDWIVEEGTASIDDSSGNDLPALAVTGDDTRVRTNFKFDSAQPFTVSFELRRPADPETARFEFRLERVGAPDEEAKFDLRLEDGQVRLEILEAELDDVFPSDADFHTVTFSVGADREATWSIDGTPLLTRADFPAAMFQIEIRTIDAAGGEFHVDNVTLTR